jgi:hypothetical protein
MFRRISKILGAMAPNAPQTLIVGDRIEMEDVTWGVVAVVESPEPDKEGWHALCVAEEKEPTPLPMMRRRWVPLAA